MRCPGGGDCFDVNCLQGGCQGYDVRVEAVTVIRTSISVRRAGARCRVAEVSLGIAAPAVKEPA